MPSLKKNSRKKCIFLERKKFSMDLSSLKNAVTYPTYQSDRPDKIVLLQCTFSWSRNGARCVSSTSFGPKSATKTLFGAKMVKNRHHEGRPLYVLPKISIFGHFLTHQNVKIPYLIFKQDSPFKNIFCLCYFTQVYPENTG